MFRYKPEVGDIVVGRVIEVDFCVGVLLKSDWEPNRLVSITLHNTSVELMFTYSVIQVAQKRWRVELNFTQDGVLMLSSMNMPDGSQVQFDSSIFWYFRLWMISSLPCLASTLYVGFNDISFLLAEAKNVCGWTQYAEYLCRARCRLCKSRWLLMFHHYIFSSLNT